MGKTRALIGTLSVLTSHSHIQSRAMSESSDNHIVMAMQPVYEKARQIKGKAGTPKDRLVFFEKEVTKQGTGVWMRAHDLLRDQLQDNTFKHAQELKVSITEFFIGIEEKFNMMCSDKEIEDEEEARLREKLQKNLVLVREKLEVEVRPAAMVCFGSL